MSSFSDKKIAGLRYMTCQSLKNPFEQVNLCFYSKLLCYLYVTIMKPEIKLIISADRLWANDRLWLNDNAMFYKTLFKINYKEISAHLRDKYFECCIFNIVQHHQTFDNKD